MAYKDLHHFIKTLENKGQLRRIKAEVDPILEITEITDRVSKDYGPALLFENPKGSNYPVLINAFGTYERMNLALEVDSLEEIADRITGYMATLPNLGGIVNKIKAAPIAWEVSQFFPRTVKSAPCQEAIEEDPDLNELPILQCWPKDAGRFVTLPLVFTKDPTTGLQNVGMYRLQVYDNNTTGMHWHLHKDGARNFDEHKKAERMEVAVAIGCDPAVIYSATAPLPKGIDEMLFAGFLRKSPVEMVKCKTVDLKVPANAEFVLEGYIDPSETRLEGPFGDHTGFYSEADYYPVFHVQCITRKKNPLYNATIVGKPPMEDCYLGKATERIFLPLLKLQLPEIVDMNLPFEGVFHNCTIVSIKKSYPGHAKKVMHALWGMGQMMYTKLIIVVDHTVNVQNVSEVMWKVFNNIDARRDVAIVDGPLDALDHSSPTFRYGAKMGIDATIKWESEGHPRDWPEDIEMSDAIKDLVTKRWNEYGIE